jgi:hypothetical protein
MGMGEGCTNVGIIPILWPLDKSLAISNKGSHGVQKGIDSKRIGVPLVSVKRGPNNFHRHLKVSSSGFEYSRPFIKMSSRSFGRHPRRSRAITKERAHVSFDRLSSLLPLGLRCSSLPWNSLLHFNSLICRLIWDLIKTCEMS